MIVLIRHAKCMLSTKKCDYREAHRQLMAYQTSSDIVYHEVTQLRKKLVVHLAQYTLNLSVSALPRSIATAQGLFDTHKKSIQAQYREFDLAIVRLPWVKLTPKTWFFVSRFAQILGFSGDAAPFSQEKERAYNIATQLQKKADINQQVLIAHGVLNHYVKKNYCNKGISNNGIIVVEPAEQLH